MRRYAAFLTVLLVTSPATAACVANPPASADVIRGFLADPNAVLSRSIWQGSLVSTIRSLAVSDPASLPGIADAAKVASPEQQDAIGTGLAQAAAICVPRDPGRAEGIQRAVVDLGISRLTSAFVATGGDVVTASTGASGQGNAANGSGGAVGGPLGGGGILDPLAAPRVRLIGAPSDTRLFANSPPPTDRLGLRRAIDGIPIAPAAPVPALGSVSPTR